MEAWERELHVARIVAGRTRIRIQGRDIFLVGPTRDHRFRAAEVFRDIRAGARIDGALDEAELLVLMARSRVWTAESQDQFDKLGKALEDLKVGLFENRLRSNARTSIRSAIAVTKAEIARLEGIRHSLDHVTMDGLAMSAKYRYLISVCLRNEDGTPCCDDSCVDEVIQVLARDRLGDGELRELARTEPWRSLWSARQASGRGLFDVAASDMTEEQRNMVFWSSIFDNVREYPNCPSDDVLADDDMMDGWMIIQRRKRDMEEAGRQADELGVNKFKDADEVYVMADTVEDAQQIEKMNSPFAMATKRDRMSFLKSKGEVGELEMPDTALRLKMEKNKLEQFSMARSGG